MKNFFNILLFEKKKFFYVRGKLARRSFVSIRESNEKKID